MPFKTTSLLLTASLALHALVVVSFYAPGRQPNDPANQSVEISYVDYAPSPAVQKPAQIRYPAMVKPANKVKEAGARVKEAPRSLEILEAKPTKKSASANSAKVSAFAVKTGEGFLTDPQKGRIFLNYFGLVKQRVRRAVEKSYLGENLRRGDVSLIFVLKPDGTVVNAFAVEKDSSADEVMRDFAIRCVKDCSPFPHFPEELGMDRISFNLSILFDES